MGVHKYKNPILPKKTLKNTTGTLFIFDGREKHNINHRKLYNAHIERKKEALIKYVKRIKFCVKE